MYNDWIISIKRQVLNKFDFNYTIIFFFKFCQRQIAYIFLHKKYKFYKKVWAMKIATMNKRQKFSVDRVISFLWTIFLNSS